MVCQRCVLAVKDAAKTSGINYGEVRLGEIEVDDTTNAAALKKFESSLSRLGFEIINDKKNQLIDKIKKKVLEYVNALEDPKRENLSVYIADTLHYDYSYLSNLFSSIEGITIEHYFILQRIEKAKELLVYDQMTLSEIAYKLDYSSVHHLSAQFKKVTGLTPSYFKKVGMERRNSLDEL